LTRAEISSASLFFPLTPSSSILDVWPGREDATAGFPFPPLSPPPPSSFPLPSSAGIKLGKRLEAPPPSPYFFVNRCQKGQKIGWVRGFSLFSPGALVLSCTRKRRNVESPPPPLVSPSAAVIEKIPGPFLPLFSFFSPKG